MGVAIAVGDAYGVVVVVGGGGGGAAVVVVVVVAGVAVVVGVGVVIVGVAVVCVLVVVVVVGCVVVLLARASTARTPARMLRWRAVQVTTGRRRALTRPSRRRRVRLEARPPLARLALTPATRQALHVRSVRGIPVILTASTWPSRSASTAEAFQAAEAEAGTVRSSAAKRAATGGRRRERMRAYGFGCPFHRIVDCRASY